MLILVCVPVMTFRGTKRYKIALVGIDNSPKTVFKMHLEYGDGLILPENDNLSLCQIEARLRMDLSVPNVARL